MEQEKKVISDIADIFQKDIASLDVTDDSTRYLKVKWGPEEYNPAVGYFGFQMEYGTLENGVLRDPKPQYIYLPEEGLNLPDINNPRDREQHIIRYDALVEVMGVLLEEMKERGHDIEWKPEPFEEATYPQFAYNMVFTISVNWGKDAGPGLKPHMVGPPTQEETKAYSQPTD
ncbi:hypothetical protein ACFL6I_16270 [candidate division KSB1 bacterium]